MATADATTSHDEIRQWVEERGGHPARVKATGSRNDPGVLRIDFPGYSGEDTLEEIEWDEFFEWFDRNNLAILLSDEAGNRFNKLVSRKTSGAKKSSSRKTSSKKSSERAASKKASSAAAKKPASTASSKKPASKRRATSKTSSSKKSTSVRSSSSAKTSRSRSTAAKKATTPARQSTTKRSTSAKKSSASPAKKSTAKKSTSGKKSSAKTARKSPPARKARATAPRARSTSSKNSKTTTDRDTIRKWVEQRGGFPAHVRETGRKKGDLGVLRIDYPGYAGKETLERVEWDAWFAAFDRNKLAFLYQDKKASRFSKLVNR